LDLDIGPSWSLSNADILSTRDRRRLPTMDIRILVEYWKADEPLASVPPIKWIDVISRDK
jgi:hypothetical protein